MTRILITGITGFAGSYLADTLLTHEPCQLFGVSREGKWPESLQGHFSKVQLFQGDVSEQQDMVRLLQQIKPEQIYHLAGHADVGESFREPQQAWQDNFSATQALYEAIRTWGGSPRILYVGSGLAYGDARNPQQLLTEESPFYPVHPYGCSKAAADLLSYQYSRFPGMEIIRARPFNHIGPRQSPRFAIAHFAKQIAAIEQELQEPIVRTGNLSACRDVTDVRDVVRAYISLMDSGDTGEAYNIASEQIYAMEDILNQLLELAEVRVQIVRESHLIRASEPSTTRVSAEKLRLATGWQPRYSLPQSLTDILNYWRSQARELISM